MFVSGLWHGAGYVFILWGLLHGLYLSINHAWRMVGPRFWPNKASYNRFMRPVGFVLTFLAVIVAMVLFRSPTVGAASDLLQGMLGLNGISVPQQIYERLGPLTTPIVSASAGSGTEFVTTITWIVALLTIALAFPNSLQIMSRHEPAIGVKWSAEDLGKWACVLDWRPSLPWAFLLSTLAATAIIKLGGKSEFLYWQF
jgi:hypothetical protein